MIDNQRFADRTALITGGGSGIGRACAVRMGSEGANVVIADINAGMGEETCRLVESAGGNAMFVETDVTREDQCNTMVEQTLARFGLLHVVVPAAGIGGGGTVVNISTQDWDRMIALDLTSVYLTAKFAVPALKHSGGGAIVTIGSLGSKTGNSAAHFAAAKGGILNLSRSMAVAHAGDNIRVNCVCPGYIKTPILGRLLSDTEWLRKAAESCPMGRMGAADEVAAAVAFLASSDASFITGATLDVDGGYLAQGKF
jgi:NAD(P)-dependent dehydrogenase (short-subunit alcohol dehydrogenase family)